MIIDNVISDILNQMTANFDFGYMLIVNVLTYLVIKILDEVNGDKVITTWQKRAVLVCAVVLVAILYKIEGYDNNIVLVNSTILAPVFWSWIARPILVKFGLDYKKVINN